MTGHVIHVDQTMHASAQQIWDVLTDVEHAADTLRSVADVTLLTDDPYGVGTRWLERRSMFGHAGTLEMRVTECEEPRHLVVETLSGHDRVTGTYTLTKYKDSTRLSITLVADMSKRWVGGKLAWTLWGEIGLHSTRSILNHDLEDIAARAEDRAEEHQAGDWQPLTWTRDEH